MKSKSEILEDFVLSSQIIPLKDRTDLRESSQIQATETVRLDRASPRNLASKIQRALCMTIAGLRTCERPTAWLRRQDSNLCISNQIGRGVGHRLKLSLQ
jgi:hypothetical protein